MSKNFRKTTQPMKIFLYQNFFSNTFTCEDHEKAYDLVSSRRGRS